MPLITIKQKYQVTIPEKLRKEANLEVGDLLDAFIEKNLIILKPKTIIDRNVAEAIKEGLDDLRAGRVTPSFSTIKEFKKFFKNKK